MTGTYVFVKHEHIERWVPFPTWWEYVYKPFLKLPLWALASTVNGVSYVTTLGLVNPLDYPHYKSWYNSVVPLGNKVSLKSSKLNPFDYNKLYLSENNQFISDRDEEQYIDKTYFVLSVSKVQESVEPSVLATLSQNATTRFTELTTKSGDLATNLSELRKLFESLGKSNTARNKIVKLNKNDKEKINILVKMVKKYQDDPNVVNELLTEINDRLGNEIISKDDIAKLKQDSSLKNAIEYKPEYDRFFVIDEQSIFETGG